MGKECMMAIITLSFVILGIVAMLRDYKAKFDKKSITLEKNDHQNEQRIKQLEQKIQELENKYERRK